MWLLKNESLLFFTINVDCLATVPEGGTKTKQTIDWKLSINESLVCIKFKFSHLWAVLETMTKHTHSSSWHCVCFGPNVWNYNGSVTDKPPKTKGRVCARLLHAMKRNLLHTPQTPYADSWHGNQEKDIFPAFCCMKMLNTAWKSWPGLQQLKVLKYTEWWFLKTLQKKANQPLQIRNMKEKPEIGNVKKRQT